MNENDLLGDEFPDPPLPSPYSSPPEADIVFRVNKCFHNLHLKQPHRHKT